MVTCKLAFLLSSASHHGVDPACQAHEKKLPRLYRIHSSHSTRQECGIVSHFKIALYARSYFWTLRVANPDRWPCLPPFLSAPTSRLWVCWMRCQQKRPPRRTASLCVCVIGCLREPSFGPSDYCGDGDLIRPLFLPHSPSQRLTRGSRADSARYRPSRSVPHLRLQSERHRQPSLGRAP